MCDTLVALSPASADGVTLFANNSDRPPREAKRLVQQPRAVHPAGGRVRCQYVEIPQVAETAAWIGSQPHWLWGVEHGVNEHRVAIGNETVFAREAPGETGLLGMDLVRLGLERARSADEALAAASGADLDTTVHLSFGDVPASEYLWQLTADAAIHAWDLARATAQDEALDATLVSGLAEWFAGVEELYRAAGAIGPAVEVDGGPQEVLLGRFGRDPSAG
jgi:hypothetical protein